jgi:hypothetical protein
VKLAAVTQVLNGYSRYVRVDAQRGYSVSWTTRVQEVEEYGAPPQYLLPVGEGRGFIWKLFSISRYAERDGGVYVELHAIALSRDVPDSVRWLVRTDRPPCFERALLTTLQQTQSAVHSSAVLAPPQPAAGPAIAALHRESTLSGDLHPPRRTQ